MAETEISCNKFTNYLVSQEPVYDRRIIADIRPTDGWWIGRVETGPFEAYSGVQHTFDRFNHVFPDLTRPWTAVPASTSCVGTPCNFTEYQLGWGSTRTTYFLEQQSWQTPLLCFDQMLKVTRAQEHFRQIISDILKPATAWIMSWFLKKRAAQFAGQKWCFHSSTPFDTQLTFSWEATGGGDIYMDTNLDPVSKLTPQFLQRRFHPQLLLGALGKAPFKDTPAMLELVTDMETVWELERAANDSYVAGNWRWMDWSAEQKYYRYGFAGAIGNYMLDVDPAPLRFNKVSAGRYQLVLPYTNVAATQGLKSTVNQDYQNAQYQFSYIHHRRAIQALTFDPRPVNPEMPFSSRNFGGKWQFVMDNLGADPTTGCVIENKRRNKGQFIADFELAIKPQYTEFEELIFHKREPACIVTVSTCNSDPGYPTQAYNSANAGCPVTITFTPTEAAAGYYHVAANSIECDGVPIVHAEVGGPGTNTIALLAAALVANVAILGTWTTPDGVTIQLAGSSCNSVTIPWTA